jgi:2-polyprenyl-3-methyl-5-hydroxy-6-metoxy-1,4-benzoquinol methylase
MKCRFDQQELTDVCIDLGFSPPSNSFLKKEQLEEPEKSYPLKLFVSRHTFLVQLAEYKNASEIFSDDYVYFSSYSTYWLEHARVYADMAVNRFALGNDSQVMEIASNDGYLLQFFDQKGIKNVGVEPSGSVAKVAQEKGIHTIQEFFGNDFARQYIQHHPQPDLIIGNNVFAHVPDINDFTAGLKTMLSTGGTITLEFPHVYNLVLQNQFDTIYHEHFWYFSLFSVVKVLAKHGLKVYDVEELPTHGGSLRLFITHQENQTLEVLPAVEMLLKKELDAGINTLEFYTQLQKNAESVKDELLLFLVQEKLKGKKIAAYGAAAKGNTLLNYCGIKPDLVQFVVDASPHKQGRWLPGSHIPVVSEDRLSVEKPDYVLILPWNLKEEIMQHLAYINNWGGKFIVPVPKLEIR